MARTLADYLDIAEHAAGGQVDASIDLEALVNDAGRYLVQMHEWAFLERPVALLATVQSQAYLTLPTDFDQLVAIGNTASFLDTSVHLLPADQFEQLKASQVSNQLDVYLALEWPTQTATTNAAGNPRLAIYPTPSSSQADRYWLNYKAGWIELTSTSAVANVPEGIEPLLIQLVRAHVRGEVMGMGPYDELEKIERSTMLKRLKESYGLVNPSAAPIEGGAVQIQSYTPDERQHDTISSLP